MESSKLQRRLDELAVEQKRVDADLKRARKLVRGCEIMTEWKYRVARAVVVLAGGKIDFGVAYVCLGKTSVDAAYVQSVNRKLRDWWETTKPELRQSFATTPKTAQDVLAVKRARKIVREQQLVDWVRDMNLNHGISPHTSVINARRQLPNITVSPRTGTQWAARWRRRWCLVLGRFAARERLTPEVKQAKAFAMWQWASFLQAQVPPEKKALHINMDETCIRLYQRGKVGHITTQGVREMKRADPLTQSVSLGQQRAACTFVALICDCEMAQVCLPQLILVGEKSMSEVTLKELRDELPDTFILRTGRNAWMNGAVMKFLFRAVAQRLQHLGDTHQIIFTMDTCGCHILKDTLRCCGRLGMWPHLIPAKMTWALQPLDTHAFAKFKSKLVSTYQELQLAQSNPSRVHWDLMIKAVVQTAQNILCGESWAGAFEHTGISGNMNLLSQNVLGKMDMTDAPVLSARLPTVIELQSIFRTVIMIFA